MKALTTFLAFIILGCVLINLQGCSINIVHADGATIAVRSDLSPGLAVYDCVAGPDADVCQ